MNCSDVFDRLSALYDGELLGAERDAVVAHLAGCEMCASEFSGMESLSRAFQAAPLPPVPLGIWPDIAAQMAKDAGQGAILHPTGHLVHSRPASRLWLPVLALAASILVVLGTGLWFSQPAENSHGVHRHDGEFAATMEHYLQVLNIDPERAERFLQHKYAGKTVDPEQAVHVVGYRPAIANGLPQGYSLTSTSVLKMPCCTCVKAVCKRQDGSTLVLFEHDDEQAEWFGHRPSNMAMCGDTQCCLVALDSSFAATWKRGSRSVTAVGVLDEGEISQLASWLDNKQDKS